MQGTPRSREYSSLGTVSFPLSILPPIIRERPQENSAEIGTDCLRGEWLLTELQSLARCCPGIRREYQREFLRECSVLLLEFRDACEHEGCLPVSWKEPRGWSYPRLVVVEVVAVHREGAVNPWHFSLARRSAWRAAAVSHLESPLPAKDRTLAERGCGWTTGTGTEKRLWEMDQRAPLLASGNHGALAKGSH